MHTKTSNNQTSIKLDVDATIRQAMKDAPTALIQGITEAFASIAPVNGRGIPLGRRTGARLHDA